MVTLNSLDRDVLLRALEDVKHTFLTLPDKDKMAQAIKDVKDEISLRVSQIDRLEGTISDAESAIVLVNGDYPDLAFAFSANIDKMREEILKLRPDPLRKKLAAMEQQRRIIDLVTKALDKSGEVLND